MKNISTSRDKVTLQQIPLIATTKTDIEEKSKKLEKRLQQAWSVGMGLGLTWTAYGLFNQDYRSVLGGLSLFGVQAIGYAGYLDEKNSYQITAQQKQEAERNDLSLRGIVKICKDDKLYATVSLLGLGNVAYGIINGFATGDFDQIKYGTGLLGMCNLIKGNLSNDNEVSKICIKLGSVASIASFLFPTQTTSIILPKDGYSLRCYVESPSVLDLFKRTFGFSF